MEVFLFWILFSFVVAFIAGNKGRSGFAWFFLSILISPLLTLILVLALKDLTREPNHRTHDKCPDCGEWILKEARVCKHCGCRLVLTSGNADT